MGEELLKVFLKAKRIYTREKTTGLAPWSVHISLKNIALSMRVRRQGQENEREMNERKQGCVKPYSLK